jgi:hypothetical protein
VPVSRSMQRACHFSFLPTIFVRPALLLGQDFSSTSRIRFGDRFFFHARVPVRAARDLCFPHRFLAAGQFPLILFACLGVERSAPVFCSHCHVLVSTDEDFVPAYPAPKIFVFPHSGFRSRGSPRHRASCCQFDLEFFFYGVLLPSRFCLLAHLCSGFVGSSLQ